jgi:hypothetical protein
VARAHTEAAVIAPRAAEQACVICGEAFSPRSRVQVTCGAQRCRDRRAYLVEIAKPEAVARNRERFRAWAETHRNVRTSNAWLRGAPPAPPFLPGGGSEIVITPHPQFPIELRNTRHLHGAVSQVLGVPHDPHLPLFALVPWACRSGWAVHIHRDDVAKKALGRSWHGTLFSREVEVRLPHRVRVRAPRGIRRGHQRVRVDAITPVVLRDSREHNGHTAPTAGLLLGSLVTGSLAIPHRMGVQVRREDVCLELIERRTQPETVPLLGKYGNIRGWVGYAVLEVNATARWLLEVAGRIGLGGRTALGFGRVIVRDA